MNEHYLNSNGKFKRGNPGRKKGSKNKHTPKNVILDAFDRIGGVDSFVKWIEESNRNKAIFYSQLWGKMIPSNVDFGEMFNGDMSVTLKVVRTPDAPKADAEDKGSGE